MGKLTEEQGEHQHRRQGLQDCPRGSQRRLLVAHLEVAPGQKVQQLMVGPQIAEPKRHPAAGRTNDGCGTARQVARAHCHRPLTASASAGDTRAEAVCLRRSHAILPMVLPAAQATGDAGKAGNISPRSNPRAQARQRRTNAVWPKANRCDLLSSNGPPPVVAPRKWLMLDEPRSSNKGVPANSDINGSSVAAAAPESVG